MIRGKQGSKKASKSRKKQKERPHIRQLLVSQASQQLSGGVFKMVLAFRMQSRIRQPASGMSSEKLRYEHRLMPFFGVIAPPVISYQQFREMCDQVAAISSPPDLFAAAFQCFDDAKRILSTIPDPSEEVRRSASLLLLILTPLTPLQITSCLKVAKTNQVVAKLLASGIPASKVCCLPLAIGLTLTPHSLSLLPQSYPEFDFSVSKIFPIIRAL